MTSEIQMTQSLVLYHDNCPDGFTAAWAAWRKEGDGAEYLAVNYGQTPPLNRVKGKYVYLVDFSYPRAVLDELASVAEVVTVIDHHKTAESDLRGWEHGITFFDMKHSGAHLSWEHFHKTPPPLLIRYVEDRDLWLWRLPDSREVSEYIFSIDRTFAEWDRLAAEIDESFAAVVKAGRSLLQAKRVRVQKICENVRLLTFGDHCIPIVNTAWDFSEIGEYLAKKFPEAPCGGYYFDRADKRQWGFRSLGDFDVSVLCKEYGGGGHRTAAGFISDIGWLP